MRNCVREKIGSLLRDQQHLTGRIDLYLGGIGMGGAQRLRGPCDRMQPSLVIHVEACHVGRLRSPVGGIQDME